MTTSLLLSVSPGEIWAATVVDGAPVELRIARDATEARVGEVFLGRVVAVKSELQAALIDLGFDRPAFLSAEDARPKGLAGLHEGEAVMVRVTKEARADKAVNVRLHVGRESSVAEGLRPPVPITPRAPLVVEVLDTLIAAAPDRIVIDDRAAFAAARAWLLRQHPDLAQHLAVHAATTALFEAEGIAAAIETALARRVMLPGGGALVIEAVAACTMIDVDSGGAAAMATNLAAAREAARQIRLRNIAGAIVIDFIGMKARGQRERVAAAMEHALAGDPGAPQILGWTRLGHLELTRTRRHPALDEVLFERGTDGARRKSALTVALEALKALARESAAAPARAPALRLAPEVVSVLGDGPAGAARRALEERLGRPIALIAEPGRARDTFDIGPA